MGLIRLIFDCLSFTTTNKRFGYFDAAFFNVLLLKQTKHK